LPDDSSLVIERAAEPQAARDSRGPADVVIAGINGFVAAVSPSGTQQNLMSDQSTSVPPVGSEAAPRTPSS
jgi:hypothetical protein